MIEKPVFKFQLGSKSFMGCHSDLHVNEHSFRSVIDEECATRVHLGVIRFPRGSVKSSFGRTDEVIDGDGLSGE